MNQENNLQHCKDWVKNSSELQKIDLGESMPTAACLCKVVKLSQNLIYPKAFEKNETNIFTLEILPMQYCKYFES